VSNRLMTTNEKVYISKKKRPWIWLIPDFTNSLTLYHNVGIKTVHYHYQNNRPQQMNLAQKNIILFVILAILASGIPALTLCSTHCVTNNPSPDFHKEVKCSLSNHSFFQYGIELSIFYLTPLLDFFLVTSILSLPTGYLSTLFRPPRFSF
jgi:hypothetical protein